MSVRDGLKVLAYGAIAIVAVGTAVESCSGPAGPPKPPLTQAEIDARRAERQREKANLARSGPRPTGPSMDGSYPAVRRYLEVILRDPDSIEFDSCGTPVSDTAGWVVMCRFRSRNGMGGVNRETWAFTIRDDAVTAAARP
jgi:hypothetical protein